MRVGIGHQVAPGLHGLVPVAALRRERTPLHVVDGLVIAGHHADAGARLDGHVADGHAAFHGQVADGAAGELQGVAVAASGADPADHCEDDVLGGHAEGQPALDAHLHVLHLLGHQALGGEHVLHLGSADTVGQRAEGAVGRGVRVATDHGHARQGGPLLRTDHMDDALADIVHLEFEDAEIVAVLVQGLDLDARHFVGDGVQATFALGLGGRHVVVRGGDVGIDAPWLAAGQTQAFKGLRRGHFVKNVTIDVDERRAIVTALHLVHFPELVVERLASHRTFPHQLVSTPGP